MDHSKLASIAQEIINWVGEGNIKDRANHSEECSIPAVMLFELLQTLLLTKDTDMPRKTTVTTTEVFHPALPTEKRSLAALAIRSFATELRKAKNAEERDAIADKMETTADELES